jgi:sigma-54-specific transcriptional regulator
MPLRLSAVEPEAPVVAMRAKALAERVAASDAAVLIIGQPGTEKELVARHVHAYSGRSGPFVLADCGAFSEHGAEVALFGAETGCLERAHGGTLFLDEIGVLPLPAQARLLRALEQRCIERPDGPPTALDLRLVAANPVELTPAVAAGRFRPDLYYRLHIAPLRLLPLAERRADILPLAQHFMALHGRRLGRDGLRLSAAAGDALLAHSWPGNLRELDSVIHCALILSQGPEIPREALRLHAPF